MVIPPGLEPGNRRFESSLLDPIAEWWNGNIPRSERARIQVRVLARQPHIVVYWTARQVVTLLERVRVPSKCRNRLLAHW